MISMKHQVKIFFFNKTRTSYNFTILFADKNQLTDLMRFHLRLAVIRNEIEMLENPVMRKIYEEINFPKENGCLSDKKPSSSYIVVKDNTIPNQINYLDAAKAFVGNEDVVKIISSLKVRLRHMHFLKNR